MTDDVMPPPGRERDRWIVRHVRAGDHEPLRWHPVQWIWRTEVVSVAVCEPLRIGGLLVPGSATLQQHLADLMGVRLLTPMVADEAWDKALHLRPQPQGPDMQSTESVRAHTEAVNREVRRAAGGPVSPRWNGMALDQGKDWVLSSRLHARRNVAVNYGWHLVDAWAHRYPHERSPDGEQLVVQGLGTRHDRWHADYSQTMRWMAGPVMIGEAQPAKVELDWALRHGWLSGAYDPSPPTRVPGVREAEPVRTETQKIGWQLSVARVGDLDLRPLASALLGAAAAGAAAAAMVKG